MTATQHNLPSGDDTYIQTAPGPAPRPGLLTAIAAGFAGLVVGVSAGILANPAAAPVEVAPEVCVSALGNAEKLFGAYGDGFNASLLTQPVAKAEGLREASAEVARLTPIYRGFAEVCRASR